MCHGLTRLTRHGSCSSGLLRSCSAATLQTVHGLRSRSNPLSATLFTVMLTSSLCVARAGSTQKARAVLA